MNPADKVIELLQKIQEKIEQIIAALEAGASKAAVCRTFSVARSTLLDTLARAGWTGTTAGKKPTAKGARAIA